MRYNSSKITIENPKELTEGWMFNDEFITLPVTLEVPKDTPYKIYRKLNHTFNDSQILMIRTSLQDIYMYI